MLVGVGLQSTEVVLELQNPAALGLIFGIPKHFSEKFYLSDKSDVALLINSTA